MFVESSVVFFMMIFFFLMLRRPTRSTRTDTLFPCAPRFRYRRRRGRVIRLELEEDIPDALELTVREGLRAGEALTFESTGFLGIADLQALVEEDRPDLKFPPFSPRFPERIREHGGDCFEAIKAKDIVVHHPYESFDVVIAFLRQAAEDPDVVAIKQTLYRAGKQSAIIRALIDAAEAGKSVTAVVRSEEHTSELQSLMRISYAVFCLKKKKNKRSQNIIHTHTK